MDEAKIKQLLDMGLHGDDIIHGELKSWMLNADYEYEEAQRIEEENDYSDAMESMDRKYWEGYTDALSAVYKLTYDIALARGTNEA